VTVSPKVETALREAMARLLEGRPRHTDGAMTKENLYREAQVSRATMNRAAAVMAEWDAQVAEHGRRTVGEARRDAELADARRSLAAKNRECTQLQAKLDAAATVIGALYHETAALTAELERLGSAAVVPLRPRTRTGT
jgi:small-conductance mechanosensitive channel